jgi:TetR/AcrR family transcriptional regulator
MADSERRNGSVKGTRRRDPEGSKRQLIEAALIEFSRKGLKGARVDEIARRARVNKQLVYHHFGNKDDLYLRCLEVAYERYRSRNSKTDFASLAPEQAIHLLVSETFDNVLAQKYFPALVADENLHSARHIKRSRRLKALHARLLAEIQEVLNRGVSAGVIRDGIDPLQLYITVAGLASFYVTNNETLSAVFSRNLGSRTAVEQRRAHIIDFVLHALRR